jgi:AP2-like factor, euAP2 lineage
VKSIGVLPPGLAAAGMQRGPALVVTPWRAGKQLYLGGFEVEAHAAEAYDIAVLKTKADEPGGPKLNFPMEKYLDLVPLLLDEDLPLNELVMAVRRQSQTYSRGSSTFRGVCRHPSGRWEARIGVPGGKHTYLGLHETEADAGAHALPCRCW